MFSIPALLGLPQGAEWIIILVVVVLIFGHRLPEIARGIGKSITEFKKGVKESDKADEKPSQKKPSDD